MQRPGSVITDIPSVKKKTNKQKQDKTKNNTQHKTSNNKTTKPTVTPLPQIKRNPNKIQ